MKSAREKKQTLSENGFRALIEHAQEGIVVYDTSGIIKFASKSVKKVCGYSEKEVMKMSGTFFVHPEDIDEARKAFRKLVKTPGKSVKLFQRVLHKKGYYIWTEYILTNFSHIAGIEGIVSNFRDITEQKKAVEQALQSRELLETINRNLTEGIYMGIIGTRFLYVNQAFLKMFGYKNLRELQKFKPAIIYADQSEPRGVVKTLKKKHAIKGLETYFQKKNGDRFWGVLNVSLLKHEGKDNYFVGTIRNISSEKEAGAALIDSRNFLDNIINTVAAPIFVKDQKHRWVMFNRKFAELIGRTQQEMYGKTDRDFLPKKEADSFWSIDNKVLRTGKTISVLEKITSRKGEIHDLLTVKSLFVNDKKEKFIIGFITDITQLKRAEEKINHLNANLRGVLESTRESIYAVDADYNYTTFNQNHKRVMKLLYNADIEIGRNKLNYLKGTPDYAWVKSEIQRALEGSHFVSDHHLANPGFTGYIRTTYNPIRNGKNEIKGAAVFVNNITERKQFEEIIKSINANLRGVLESTNDHVLAVDRDMKYITFNRAHARDFKKLFDANIRFGQSFLTPIPAHIRKNVRKQISRALRGEQFIVEDQFVEDTIFEVSLNPIRNDKGLVTGVAIFARDITLRKTIEEKLLELNEELLHQNTQLAAQEEELKATLEELSERNFELDQLMYKTSHDLRSPLSSIMGLVNLANLDTDATNHRQYLSKIDGRIKKLDEFIRSMLNYARVNRVELSSEPIDLKEVALSCIKELEYLENFKAVNTQIEVNEDIPFSSDSLRIRIIFSNIISNAYKYYNPEVSSYIRIYIRVTPKDATLEFHDNGIGIRPEYLDKIFNMFYRATDRSQGSGLGMYIVKQAVEKLKGNINIASEYGKGTRIIIHLPNG
ncbi:MAG TPA: PAS domain S-box protein [Ohtaekwangia sp.]|uniref:PAS domain S-box protein n=1 Tax=Ohtaekwangia sp. TaxID=2066019 RepID=UPI002F949405